MTPEEAFLQDITDHPEDDTPRLIFADWLEERGDPGGEFIRLQVERSRLKADDSRQDFLRDRLRQILAEHGEGWRSQLPRLPGISWQGRFWRGFVSGANVERLKFYRRSADKLFAATPIQFLRFISLNDAHCGDLTRSPYLGRLLGLDLSGTWVGDAGVRALAACPLLANLRMLGLCGGPLPSSFRPLRRSLFGDPGAFALAASPYLDRLERLEARDNRLSTAATQALRHRFGDCVHL